MIVSQASDLDFLFFRMTHSKTEHADSLAKPYRDNKSKLREILAKQTLQRTNLFQICFFSHLISPWKNKCQDWIQ